MAVVYQGFVLGLGAMQNRISWAAVAAGAAVGAVGVYAYFKVLEKKREKYLEEQDREREEEKERTLLKPGESPLPEPPRTIGMHRDPKPQVQVWVPQSLADRQQLDDMICEVWTTYDSPPTDISDFVMDVLDELAPEGDWPTVPGDHPSLHSLQAIVGFRIDEIGQTNKNQGIVENFNAFCVTEGVPPTPKGPGLFKPGA
jgi:hypothetical protein